MPKLLDRCLEKGKYLFNFYKGKQQDSDCPKHCLDLASAIICCVAVIIIMQGRQISMQCTSTLENCQAY
jgi:hypothetical protein